MRWDIKGQEQIQEEIGYGDVLTIEEFFNDVMSGCLTPYDGIGYFHDGINETKRSVWDENLSLVELTEYPYVTWYNK